MLNSSILVVAAALRFYALTLKPLHHDEGINGLFLVNLLREGLYTYDPANYHGPTLYYLTVPFAVFFGLHDFVLRLLPVLCGIGIVWLLLSLRRQIGEVGAVVSALLIAVSPAAVFFSRYFIHETPFVFFTLALVVSLVRLREQRTPRYLFFAAASAALLFATKETAFISVIVLFLAALIATAWTRRWDWHAPEDASAARLFLLAWAAFALFTAINVVFYSSFFTNWPGLSAAVRSLAFWTQTGASDFHAKPFATYGRWLFQEEAPIFLLAIAGGFAALLIKPLNRFAIFSAAWGFGMLLAYSLIPYKTPWLVLNFLIPMSLAAGYVIECAVRRHAASRLLVVAAAGVCLYQTVVLNFREYDNDAYPYVYAQTRRPTLELLAEVDRISERTGMKPLPMTIATPEYWPLPWYFRDDPMAGYTGTVAPIYDPKTMPVIIVREDQVPALWSAVGSDYLEVGKYSLRPGVDLVLFVRNE